MIFLSRSGDRDANTATYLCARRARVCVYVYVRACVRARARVCVCVHVCARVCACVHACTDITRDNLYKSMSSETMKATGLFFPNKAKRTAIFFK